MRIADYSAADYYNQRANNESNERSRFFIEDPPKRILDHASALQNAYSNWLKSVKMN